MAAMAGSPQLALTSLKAKHRREVEELSAQNLQLGRQFARSEERLREATTELRRLRSNYEAQARDLAAQQRRADSAVAEQKAAEEEAAQLRLTVKKVEHRLVAQTGVRALEEAAELTTAARELRAECERKDDEIEFLRSEVEVLKAALQVKAHDLGDGVRAELLQQLAQARSDARDGARQSNDGEALYERLRITSEQLQEARDGYEESLLLSDALTRDLAAVREALASAERDRDDALVHAQDLIDERDAALKRTEALESEVARWQKAAARQREHIRDSEERLRAAAEAVSPAKRRDWDAFEDSLEDDAPLPRATPPPTRAVPPGSPAIAMDLQRLKDKHRELIADRKSVV